MILVVDDDDTYELLMPRLFQELEAPPAFRFVRDGEQGIDYLSGNGAYADRSQNPFPKMVLLDLRMPRVNGFEVLEWKRQQPDLAHIPVVVWSSSPLLQDREKAASLGAVDYIVKPIIGRDLVEAIERIYRTLTEARLKARTH